MTIVQSPSAAATAFIESKPDDAAGENAVQKTA